MQSQSMDSEAPPPAGPKTASYNNLFDTSQDVPLGGSAHSLRNHLTSDPRMVQRNGAQPPRTLYTQSPQAARYRPPYIISQQAPMASGEELSPASPSKGGEVGLASDQMYPTTQALITDTVTHPTPIKDAAPPPKPKTLRSQGVRANVAPPQPKVPTTNYYNQTGGPPQPTVHHYVTHPAKKDMGKLPSGRYRESGYSSNPSRPMYMTDQPPAAVSSISRGAPSYPLPQATLQTVPGAVRRPMSFVKALEMTDQLAMEEQRREQRHQQQRLRTPGDPVPEESAPSEHRHPQQQQQQQQRQLYGSSYEISV